ARRHQRGASNVLRRALSPEIDSAPSLIVLSSVLEQSLNVGVGISTGYVTVGNIGSPSRLEYTVIGGHVSLATRLADRAKPGQARPGGRPGHRAEDRALRQPLALRFGPVTPS